MSNGFPRGVAEHLEWYVYALRDPLAGGEIFYVGKGSRDRVYQHAWEALDGEHSPTVKRDRIRRILAAGEVVVVEIIRHHLDEKTAYEVEAGVIDALTVAGIADLANIAYGHGSTSRGYLPLEELVEQYAAPRVEFDKAGPKILLVQLRNSWYRGMPAEELHEKTCGWWLCSGRRREHVELVVGVANGLIRSVYRVRPGSWKWTMDGDRKRWACDGEREERLWATWAGGDASHYLAPGSRASFRYLPA